MISCRKFLTFVSLCLVVFFSAGTLAAQDFSSTNFTVKAPVLFPGGYSTSDNFTLSGVISQMAIGTSTITTFDLFGGFLYFPFVSTPVAVATPGVNKVDLSWTSASASTGWSVSAYNVGQSTVSGGPYTFSNVGVVLSSSRTGLTAGTTYYFVIQVLDAFNFSIATSTEVSAIPTAPAVDDGGGGGGGGGGGIPQSSVNISGRAYPASQVTLLKDGQIAVETIAGLDANFQISLTGLSSGNFNFILYGEDKDGKRSNPVTFTVVLTAGANTNITGIFLAPTIGVDKSVVKRGDNIAIFGQSAANADITISINSEEEFFAKTKSDKGGAYLYNLDTAPLEFGQHSTKSKGTIDNEISSFGKLAVFTVGTENVLAQVFSRCPEKGDINGDCKVNLLDFSIAAFWYKRSLSSSFKTIEIERLNRDGKVDLVDFSIMAYYWSG